MKNAILRRFALSLNVLAVAIPIQAPIRANEKTVSFVVPAVKIPLNVKDQRIVVVAAGLITLTPKKQALDILDLRLEADLSDLQLHMTDLLSEQVDKDDRCGDQK